MRAPKPESGVTVQDPDGGVALSGTVLGRKPRRVVRTAPAYDGFACAGSDGPKRNRATCGRAPTRARANYRRAASAFRGSALARAGTAAAVAGSRDACLRTHSQR